jgi:hypothetical protein
MLSTVKYPVPKTTLVSKPMAFKPLAKAAPPAKKAEEAPIFLQSECCVMVCCNLSAGLEMFCGFGL